MPTLGPTTERTYGAEWWGSSVSNQYCAAETMPEDGRVTYIGIWCRGKDASCSIKGAVWDSTRNTVLGSTSSYTVSGAAFSTPNSIENVITVPTPFDIASGTGIHIGFCKSYTGAIQFSFNNTDSHFDDDNGSSNPSGMTGETTHSSRQVAFYITYETVPEVYLRRTGAWVQTSAVYARRSGAWSNVGPDVYVRRSGAWVKA